MPYFVSSVFPRELRMMVILSIPQLKYMGRCNDNNVDINVRTHDSFLEYPVSGTIIAKIFGSQISL